MARTIMDTIHENVNPVSVSNALYEMMLDWRSCVMLLETDQAKSKNKIRHKKSLIERYLAWFLGTDGKDIRVLLEQHFGVGGR